MRCNVAGERLGRDLSVDAWKGVRRSGKVQWWMQCGLCRSMNLGNEFSKKNHMEYIQLTDKR